MGDLGNTGHKLWFSVFLAGAGSVGGFLFGYDLGVISGSLPLLSDEFELSDVEEEMVVALQAVGSVLGACIGGYVCDHIGRLKTVCLYVYCRIRCSELFVCFCHIVCWQNHRRYWDIFLFHRRRILSYRSITDRI